jgi:hypothetical protein
VSRNHTGTTSPHIPDDPQDIMAGVAPDATKPVEGESPLRIQRLIIPVTRH